MTVSEIEKLSVSNYVCKVNVTYPVVGDRRVQLLALAEVPTDKFVLLHQALQFKCHVFFAVQLSRFFANQLPRFFEIQLSCFLTKM